MYTTPGLFIKNNSERVELLLFQQPSRYMLYTTKDPLHIHTLTRTRVTERLSCVRRYVKKESARIRFLAEKRNVADVGAVRQFIDGRVRGRKSERHDKRSTSGFSIQQSFRNTLQPAFRLCPSLTSCRVHCLQTLFFRHYTLSPRFSILLICQLLRFFCLVLFIPMLFKSALRNKSWSTTSSIFNPQFFTSTLSQWIE